MDKVEDINPKSKRTGTTPLHIAVRKGDLDMVKFLVSKINGANINTMDNDNETPYTLSIKKNLPEIVKILIEKTDDPNPELQLGKKIKVIGAQNLDFLPKMYKISHGCGGSTF